jgi:hypothetical protein
MTRFWSLLLLPLLCACLVVTDFGTAWKEASDDLCLNRIAMALYRQLHEQEPPSEDMGQLARAVTWDGEHYLLLKKKPEDRGGFLFRFTVKSGVFTRYRLNPTMRDRFAQDYPDAPVEVADSTVTLAQLGAAERALLGKVAKDARYWQREDRTLYNTALNPACRFDDRDLDASRD